MRDPGPLSSAMLLGVPRARAALCLCTAAMVFLALGLWGAAPAAAAPGAATNRFDAEVERLVRQDPIEPPPKEGVLFVGSSSIRLWKSLATDFPEFIVLNRGFGGSHMSDVVDFADRIILPYRPRIIVVYAGDNDIAAGKTPRRVFEDFKALEARVRQALPGTRLGFISIKPSPSRWKLAEQARAANRLVEDYARGRSDVFYLNVFDAMLDRQGVPRADLFVEDQLHLNARGYELWRDLIHPVLRAAATPAALDPAAARRGRAR